MFPWGPTISFVHHQLWTWGPALCKSVNLDLDLKLKLWISHEQLLFLCPPWAMGGGLIAPFLGGGSQCLMGLNPRALPQCLASSSLGRPGVTDQMNHL